MKTVERILYVLVFIILTLVNFQARNKIHKIIQSSNYEIQSITEVYNYLRQLEMESEHYVFDKDQYLYSGKNDSVNIEEWARTPKLVVFLHEYSCRPCIDTLISCLIEVFGPSSFNVVFIGSRNGIKMVQPMLNQNKIEYLTWYLKNMDLDIPSLQNQYSFLCVIDNELKTQYVHIPDKGASKRTMNYLRYIMQNILTE